MDSSLPGSSVHGNFKARILGWVAMPSSRGSSQPRNWTHILHLLQRQACSLPLVPHGKAPPCSREVQWSQGEAHMKKNWSWCSSTMVGSEMTVFTNLPAMWVNHHESRSSSPKQVIQVMLLGTGSSYLCHALAKFQVYEQNNLFLLF